jgi:hypothetical protein
MQITDKKISEFDGFTIPELIVSMLVLTTIIIATFSTYSILVRSAGLARMKSAGLGLATEQLEYLKGLPYDYLALQGGAINSSGPKLPVSFEKTSGPYTFVVTTSIRYVDDAFDGCLSYPMSQSYLCVNGPADTGLPIDSNPRDYKLIDVNVNEKKSNKEVARVSTHVAARVAETAGNTGALLVNIITSSGEPVAGAAVTITNSTLMPSLSQTITSDTNGAAIFLDVPPDSGKDYVVSVTKAGHSSLSTIPASGSLVPVYPNVSVLAQTVTNSTLKIDALSSESLRVVSRHSSDGTIRPNTTMNIRGGVKLYTDNADQTYSYSQNITTDINGEILLSNLTPGNYYLCYSSNQGCASGVYLAVSNNAYGGSVAQPIVVAPGNVSESGSGPMQIVNAFITTNNAHVKLADIQPSTIPQSGDLSSIIINITGSNLTGSSVTLRQGGVNLSTVVDGTDQNSSIYRGVDLSGQSGAWEVVVTNNGTTSIMTGVAPGTLGGVNVTP